MMKRDYKIKNNNGYLYKRVKGVLRKDHYVRLDRYVLGIYDPKAYIVHLDGDQLNCSKQNLFPITREIKRNLPYKIVADPEVNRLNIQVAIACTALDGGDIPYYTMRMLESKLDFGNLYGIWKKRSTRKEQP